MLFSFIPDLHVTKHVMQPKLKFTAAVATKS